MTKGDFGEWVLEEMRAAGIRSQVELAERIHVTPATVNKWIKGTRTPDVDSVRDLARVLNVSRLVVYQKLGWAPVLDDEELHEWTERLARLKPQNRQRLAAIAEVLIREDEAAAQSEDEQ